MHNYIISTQNKEVTKLYGMREFFITNVYNWMNILGMKYCNRKKNYYVDVHDRKYVINEIWEFVKKYLENDICMYWWVQIILKEAIRLNIDSGGYKYVLREDCSSMVEFRVDVHRSFQETIYLT